MAYTNETTHYGIPLPLGSDLTTPMDYNQSMQDVDTALFASKTDSSSALQKANQLQLDLATTNDNLTGVAGRVTTLEGTSVTQGQAILQNTQDIADVRADALDMIVAKDEGTAQVATVDVTEGEYFRYNDVLYIATDDIAIGDTIVPNENCRATNVGTELVQLNDEIVSGETLIATLNSSNVQVTDISPYDYHNLTILLGYGNYRAVTSFNPKNVSAHTIGRSLQLMLKYWDTTTSAMKEIAGSVSVNANQIFASHMLIDNSEVVSTDTNWFIWIFAK